jgi:predicted O-linked N-acetylglucosamine transferase (SPINDLY family)
VPDSVLWLLVRSKVARSNLREEAKQKGIEPGRICFAERLPKDEHLARLALSDLALDTRIYNGHTTTSDALWAGVPVVTLQGRHFASRVSSSLLSAMGMPELITHSLEEYESLIVRLALSKKELLKTREKLEKQRRTAPLFDTPRFVRNLEQAFTEMCEILWAGEPPRHIDVVES